jgi:hypothetical protein
VDSRAGRPGHGGPCKFFAEARDELIDYAAHQFFLAQKERDGRPRREHLEAAVAAGSSEAREELEGPLLPAHAAHLWDIFFEIAQARGGNGFGLNPIGWTDIARWQEVTGFRLSRFERSVIFELDRLYLSDAAEELKKRRAAKPGG